ncbi:MAG: thioredoxin [Ruminococcaceae bacterium]|nr:thioredoxin [Oscillospiraceae bacterium]
MIIINKENFQNEVEEYKGLVVIDLYADWCGPCRMLAPVLAELEAENPNVKFCKINVDEEPELARAFNVTSIPMIAFVKDNTFADVSVGYVPKSTLQGKIEENL